MRQDGFSKSHRRSIRPVTIFLLSAGLMLSCVASDGLSFDDDTDDTEEGLDLSRVVLSGLNARAVPAGNYIFDGAKQWDDFWARFQDGPAPEIDFEEFTLAAVFLGRRPNPGHSVKIIGAKERGGETVVEVIEYLPPPGMMYAQVIVYPYDAALIPKIDGAIRFEVSKKTGRPKGS